LIERPALKEIYKMSFNLINDQDKQYAEKKLKHFYSADRIPAEKKAYLTHHQGSSGPYLGIEAEDGSTHYLMDAASQIATLGLGFGPNAFMGVGHHLEAWANQKNSKQFKKARESFENFLKRKTGWSEMTSIFCNSGAEANEIALGQAYKRRFNQSANKVLAFEGSFHGRMLVSLASTWNKSKREPFAWPGLDSVYCPYPELNDDQIHLAFPKDWRCYWENCIDANVSTPSSWNNDPVLKLEVDCLYKVQKELQSGQIFAIIIEPMQCEGGDRYSSDRFQTALALMANAYQVAIIQDEVQTGFHLGKEFFWHKEFNIKNEAGTEVPPDYLICAKKSQIGMVLSPHRFSYPRQSEQFHVASALRGYIHGLALDQAQTKIHHIEKICRQHLDILLSKFPNDLARPRVRGISFAFEINNKDHVMEFIKKRFDHGLLFYPAGEKTLRFRLNTAYSDQHIAFLFQEIEAMANEIFLNKKIETPIKAPPAQESKEALMYQWHHLILKYQLKTLKNDTVSSDSVIKDIQEILEKMNCPGKLKLINKDNFSTYKDSIIQMEEAVYEPTRQTAIDIFEKTAASKDSVCLCLEDESKGELVGIAFSGPLSLYPLERGLRIDPDFDNPKVLYTMDTTIAPIHQGKGLGSVLKYSLSLLALAKGAIKTKGRNRDKLAAGMLNINLSLGAVEDFYLKEDYPDFEKHRDVLYYCVGLPWKQLPLNLSSRTDAPFGTNYINEEHIIENLPYMNNKVCLSNFVSLRFLEHMEKISSQMPKNLQHCYSASGQSECVDKIAKSIRYTKEKAGAMLTFEGHYFGLGSFLSRDLSSNKDNFFPVTHLPHPSKENEDQVIKLLEKQIQSEDIMAIWIEPTSQKSLQSVSHNFLKQLKEISQKNNIPLVYNETASQQYAYSKDYYFASLDSSLTPDAIMCFLGGQAAIVGIKEDLFVKKPLMMISTWDGDEFSFAQYIAGMDEILNNTDAYNETCEHFDQKLKEWLNHFPVESIQIERGKGHFKGLIPKRYFEYFDKIGPYFIVNPNWEAMVRFLKDLT
jgi:acetylornithine/succinyldiaminopimelate/putrescine aminotransferase